MCHIEKRGEDRYRILIDQGRDARGKRKRLSRTVRGSRKKAEVELATLLGEIHGGTYAEPTPLAVRWQLISRNPCDLVDPPRVEEKEMTVLADEKEVGKLMAAVGGSRLYLPVVLALTTGMRRGEILALRWQDVDHKTGECRVARSLQETPEGLSYKVPKTRKGRRVVLLPQLALAAIKAQRAVQNEEKLLIGTAYQDEDLIICRPDGTPWPLAEFS